MSNIEIKDKQSLLNFLTQRLANRRESNKKDVADQQELNKINVHMGNVCGKKCLNDLRTTSLNTLEESCLTDCAKTYFAALEKGDDMYKSISQPFKF
jgi:hypothetical protein